MVRKNNSGFTLVEMMVVISIIGILIAIALPAMSAARESARNSACMNNLRQFGIGLTAVANRVGTFGTGAIDWRRDGAVTEFGWVANLIDQGTVPGEMLCMSNPRKITETYGDLLQATLVDPDPCNPNVAGSEPKTQPDGTVVPPACRAILGSWTGNWDSPWEITYTGGSPPTGEDRRLLVENAVYLKGYNTNYTASWFMVRSEPVLKDGNLSAPSGCVVGIEERTCTLGPLNLARLDSAAIPISHVPLMADGGPSDRALPSPIGTVQSGELMTDAVSDGPVLNFSMKPPTGIDPSDWWTEWVKKSRQDYRSFAPVHGRGTKRSCNILFADGSVRSYLDSNGDGLLNNGFKPALYAGTGEIGFTDDTEELLPTEVFSGWAIRADGK